MPRRPITLESRALPPAVSQVRYWLYDLATEIALRRRRHIACRSCLEPSVDYRRRPGQAARFSAPGTTKTVRESDATGAGFAHFLTGVAAAALTGSVEPVSENGFPVPIPLPLHARHFLEQLPQLSGADMAAATLKPLLSACGANNSLASRRRGCGVPRLSNRLHVSCRDGHGNAATMEPVESGFDGPEHVIAAAQLAEFPLVEKPATSIRSAV